MEEDNRIQAYQNGTKYIIVDSFTWQAQDSRHICPNSFRAGVSQLTSTLLFIYLLLGFKGASTT